MLATEQAADLAMFDWCIRDFVLIAIASGGVIAFGVFAVSKIVKW